MVSPSLARTYETDMFSDACRLRRVRCVKTTEGGCSECFRKSILCSTNLQKAGAASIQRSGRLIKLSKELFGSTNSLIEPDERGK